MTYGNVKDAYDAFCRLFGPEPPAWTYEQFKSYRFSDGVMYEEIDDDWLETAFNVATGED